MFEKSIEGCVNYLYKNCERGRSLLKWINRIIGMRCLHPIMVHVKLFGDEKERRI